MCIRDRDKYEEAESISALSDGHYGYFIRYIIDNRRDLGTSNIIYAFWKEYGESLLKVRNRKDIKAILDEIEKITQKLKETSIEIKKEIVRIRDDYRREYKLLTKDLDEHGYRIVEE